MKRTTLIGIAALVAASGSALGQAAAQGDFDRPLRHPRVVTRAAPEARSDSHSEMHQTVTDGDTRIEIVVKDGKVSARVNGKEVPEDHIQTDGSGRITLLDDEGKPIEFGGHVFHGGNGAFAIEGLDGLTDVMPGLAVEGVPVEPPKVMIGINMSETSADLMEHLGFEAGTGVRVDGVYDHLPAAEAGIKAKDIIVAVDGENFLGSEGLREVINAHEAGDTVKFTVIRKGQAKDISVTLKAYDAEALGQTEVEGFGTTPDVFEFRLGQQGEYAKQLEEMARQMAESHGNAEQMREHSEAMRRLAEQLAQSIHDGPSGPGTYRFRTPQGDRFFVAPQGVEEVPLVQGLPTAPSAPAGDLNERLDRLEKKLERLEKLLDRLAEDR
ncbi:MAG: serine protease [Phycisphaerales bacterium]|nr:serine protease [Phycisphaerales bacterium]